MLLSPAPGFAYKRSQADTSSSAVTLAAAAGVQVVFDHVEMRYRPGLPLVLKGLSVTIPAASKCGVVGRTGQAYFWLTQSL